MAHQFPTTAGGVAQDFDRQEIKEEYDYMDRGDTDFADLMCRTKGCPNNATCHCDG
mgnify:CR=1 FL=1